MRNIFYRCLSLLLLSLCLLSCGETSIEDHTITVDTKKMQILVHYPEIYQPIIDKDSKGWAQQLVETFQSSYKEEQIVQNPYELDVKYTITRPSDKAISIVYVVSSYTGGAHGNLEFIVFNYNTDTGKDIDLVDMFENVDTALQLMATQCYKKLSETLGDMLDETMLRNGTAPEIDNYTAVAFIPKGIRIFFQPYQVAPWAAGPQHIDMTLKELEAAKPNMIWWKV